MKIVVVGGKGFIGSEFVKFIQIAGHEVFVIDSSYNVFTEAGYNRVSDIISRSDALVLLAARRSNSNFDINDYYYNIQLAQIYFDIAKDCAITNVAITSSISVYSSDKTPWKEDTLDTPLSLYGTSKQAIDSLAIFYNEQYDMKIKSFRLAQVIGLGERKGYLLNTLIDNAIRGDIQTIYGKGTGRRQYIYIKDVCDILFRAISQTPEACGIYNVGMKDNISIIELAETINDVFDNSAGLQYIEYNKEDTRKYLMSTDKVTQQFRWSPEYDIRKALEDIRNEIK